MKFTDVYEKTELEVELLSSECYIRSLAKDFASEVFLHSADMIRRHPNAYSYLRLKKRLFLSNRQRWLRASEISPSEWEERWSWHYSSVQEEELEELYFKDNVYQDEVGEAIYLFEKVANAYIQNQRKDSCDDCQKIIVITEEFSFRNESDREICADCSDDYRACASCHYPVHLDNVYNSPGEQPEPYCSECFYDRYFHCEECGDTGNLDESRWCEDREQYFCTDCYSNVDVLWEVQDDISTLHCSYGRRVEAELYGDEYTCFRYIDRPNHDELKSRRFMGVEIECHNYTSDFDDIQWYVRKAISSKLDRESLPQRAIREFEDGGYPRSQFLGVQVVTDGSINGIDDGDVRSGEVVLSPRQGSYFIRDVDAVCSGLKANLDSFVTHRTGLHLHIDSRDLDWYHRAVLTMFTKLAEPHIYSWLAPSRHNGHYSRPISQQWNSFREVTGRSEFIDFWYDTNGYTRDRHGSGKRYHSLNMHCSFAEDRTGSIELRHHQGTLNANKIKHWAIFWGCIFDKCKEIGDSLYSLRGEDCIKETVDEMLSLPSRYYRSSYDVTNKYLKGKVNYRNISELRNFFKRSYNPIIDIDNFFNIMEIPYETKYFYISMLRDRLRSDEVTRNAIGHYSNCFYNNMGVVEWDEETMLFKSKSFEEDKIELKNERHEHSQHFYKVLREGSSIRGLSSKNLESTLLKHLADENYRLPRDILESSYSIADFTMFCNTEENFKYRLVEDIDEDVGSYVSRIREESTRIL